MIISPVAAADPSIVSVIPNDEARETLPIAAATNSRSAAEAVPVPPVVVAGLVAVGGTVVAVGGTRVAVGGTGVAVGGTGVAVGGTGVAVGGTGVAVGGIGVAVGTGVAVGGTGVAVGVAPQAARAVVNMASTSTMVKLRYNVGRMRLLLIGKASPASPPSVEQLWLTMAERVGFEPTKQLAYAFSRRAPSTTRTPLRVRMLGHYSTNATF
jgi:hypothetical protein